MKNKKSKYLVFTAIFFFIGMINVSAADSANKYIQCGENVLPYPMVGIVSNIYRLFQILLPVVLIIYGSIDFVKAVSAGDQDKIKKNQSQFIKRITTAIVFFFVFTVIKFGVGIIADNSENTNISNCLDCLFSGEESCGSVTTTNPYVD